MDCKEVDNGAIDRISSLPLHVLHHMLSFLPTEDVIRTGALSKTWNGVCVSYPNLNFDHNHRSFKFGHSERDRFVNHVSTSLNKFCQQGVRMRKLRVKCKDSLEMNPSLSEWLVLALEKGVEELYFGSYILYVCRYVYRREPDLYLKTPLKFQFENCKKFDSLKKLSFQGIFLDEATFENLLTVCPLIEDLELCAIYGLKRLHIPKVKRLVRLSIDFLHHLESTDIETESIRELTLMRTCCVSLLNYLASRFLVLETLRIIECKCENGLKITSLTLKILELVWNEVYGRVEIHTPNLCSFTYSTFFEIGFPRDMMIPPCHCHLKIAGLEDDENIATSWFVDMKNLLAKSKQVIGFDCSFTRCFISFSFDDAEETNLPSVPSVEKMCLAYYNKDDHDEFAESNYEAMLNGILWCCHPKMIFVDSCNQLLTKYLCKQFESSGDASCCSLTPVKCWRHDLKEVEWYRGAEGKICFELTWQCP